MKTRLLPCAAGLLLAAGAASAELNISGSLDIGLYRGFDNTAQVGTVQRSHLAFSGSEPLGGGMAATFKLSHRLDLDQGSAEGAGSKPFWQGESTVGLRGSFGHLRLGRALDVVSAGDWAYDPWYNFDRIASPAWQYWHWNFASSRTSNRGSAEYGRLSDGVFYDSPVWHGVSLRLSGAFENSDPSAGAGNGNNAGASIHYDQGPASLMLARSRNASGDEVLFVGGRLTVGQLQLMGAYDRSVFQAVPDSVAEVVTLGATYALGNTSLKAGHGWRRVGDARARFLGLGASHALSRRTTAYISAGHDRPPGIPSRTAYGLGMTHTF